MFTIPIVFVVLFLYSAYYIFRNGHRYFQMIDEYIDSSGKDEELLRKINRIEDISIVLGASCIILALVSYNILSHENLHSN